ncbi:MAG: ABC transporter permease [Pseudomonadota bacterium]
MSDVPVSTKPRTRSFGTLRSVSALVLREMATTYGRSPGGYVWAVLEPVGAIAILTLAFSVLLRSPSLGTNFALFYATGYLPFALYAVLSAKIAQAIRFSRPLLAYPSVTYVDAILGRLVLNLLTQIMVFYIVMTGLHVVYDLRTVLDLPAIMLSLAMATALGVGVGVINCFLMSILPVWENIWQIVNRPLFIISGVLFIYEDLPRVAQNILWYNPLVHVTGVMRTGFYPTYDATYVSLSYVFGVSLVLTVLGMVLLGRFHRLILNERR